MKKIQRLLYTSMALTVLIISILSTTAFAVTQQYYKTWEEYAEANEIDSRNWHIVADAVDIIIERAAELYEAGDTKEAYEYAKATYWGYYETTGFERNTMTYISGSRVSQVELQFTSFRKAVKNDDGIDAVREEGKKLSLAYTARLVVIRKLYEQQKYMYDHKVHSVPDRIVSISQPYIRPIV